MANYRNKFYTVLKDDNQNRLEVREYLTSAQLNGKVTKNYMVLKEVVAGEDSGPEIRFQPEETISGL